MTPIVRVSGYISKENRITRRRNEKWVVRATYAHGIEEKPYKTEKGANQYAEWLRGIKHWDDSPLICVEVIEVGK